MITIHQNTAWGLRGASQILLLCIIHGSYAVQNIDAQGGHDRMADLKFSHLTTNDGLSQSNVTEILQDRRGFMWFATRDGLNRYDGSTFVVYKHDPNDPGSLSANFVLDLVEDDRGYLWIATNAGGVNKFDPTTERFTRYRHDPNNPNSISGDSVETIARDSRGLLWFGTSDSGLDKFDPTTGTFTHYPKDRDGKFVGRITKGEFRVRSGWRAQDWAKVRSSEGCKIVNSTGRFSESKHRGSWNEWN
jgi:ligand-binding sensor domain-containing protein